MTFSSPHEANVAADLTIATRSNVSKGYWQSKSDEQVQLSPWTPGTSDAPFFESIYLYGIVNPGVLNGAELVRPWSTHSAAANGRVIELGNAYCATGCQGRRHKSKSMQLRGQLARGMSNFPMQLRYRRCPMCGMYMCTCVCTYFRHGLDDARQGKVSAHDEVVHVCVFRQSPSMSSLLSPSVLLLMPPVIWPCLCLEMRFSHDSVCLFSLAELALGKIVETLTGKIANLPHAFGRTVVCTEKDSSLHL